jgi:hypothetical protein
MANPPTDNGVTAASAPPAIITSASPCRIMRAESPMALAEVAQAVAVAEIGPVGAVADAHLARRHVDDGRGNEEGRDLARAALHQVGVLALDDFKAADAGADEDAHPFGNLRGNLETRLAMASWVAARA